MALMFVLLLLHGYVGWRLIPPLGFAPWLQGTLVALLHASWPALELVRAAATAIHRRIEPMAGSVGLHQPRHRLYWGCGGMKDPPPRRDSCITSHFRIRLP